jgi:hypothetical protein
MSARRLRALNIILWRLPLRYIANCFVCFVVLVLICVSASAAPAPTQDIISTYAGGGPNNLPATNAGLDYPEGIVFDSGGNLYIASQNDHRVYKVDTGGNLTLFAGAGWCGYSGDGFAATQAALCYPVALALDNAGNVYIADRNNVVRMVNTSGIITTYAGNGSSTYSGDGMATSVGLCHVYSLATGATGGANYLYIGSSCSRVFRVDTTGALTTFAGNGVNGYAGDGGSALLASISQPQALVADTAGNVYFADANNYRIRKVASGGTVSTVIGTGVEGSNSCQSSSTAGSTPLSIVHSLALDSAGNLYYEDLGSYCVLKLTTASGYVSPVAGTGAYYTGSSLGATAGTTAISDVYEGLAVDGSGNLFISDYYRQQILKVVPVSGSLYFGAISVVAGNGTAAFAGNGAPAFSAKLNRPYGMTTDGSGNLYFADQDNGVVRKIDSSNVITTVAGVPGTCGSSGDGGLATAAELCDPVAVAIGPITGNLYITDYDSIRVVDGGGNIRTYATSLLCPTGIAVDSTEAVYVAENCKHVVTKFTGGSGSTYAGIPNSPGFSGDGAAISENLNYPAGLAFDSAGNLYIADEGNYRVRKIDGTGQMTTVAGNGDYGYEADNVSALSTGLEPWGLAFDPAGNLLITELDSPRVRLVDGTGTIHTFAGTGNYGYSGDGGIATSAKMTTSFGIAVDPEGNVYFSDSGNNVIREVTAIPLLNASANSVAFPPQVTGATSAPQNIVLTSFGQLNVTGISSSGDFGFSNTCGTSYNPAPGTQCTLSITFTPTQTGMRMGSIVISDNALYGSPMTINLSGTGLTPTTGLTLSSTSVNFGYAGVGTSKPQVLSLTNYTGASVNNVVVSTGSAAFPISADGCTGKALAAAQVCTFTASFAPSGTGLQSGTLTVSSSATTNPTAALSGTGVPAVLTLGATSVAFGTLPEGTSKATVLSLTNYTGASVNNIALSTGSEAFPISADGCTGTVLAAGKWCYFTVSFAPSTTGAQYATLTVSSSATTNPTAPLSGTGMPPIYLSTSTLAFGSEGVGVPTAAKTVYFYNYSGAAVSPTITLSGGTPTDFVTSTSPCWSSVPNNSSCAFTVSFNPAGPGAVSSTLNVQAGATTLPVALTGTGVPTLSLSTSTLGFGNQAVGVPTAPVTLYFYNYSGAAVSPTLTLSGGTASDFATSTSPCWSSVPNNSSCSFTVTFTPAGPGAVSSTLNVQVGATTLSVALTGTGVAPFSLSTSKLAFGTEVVGVPSAPVTLFFYNYSGAAVSPTITLSGGTASDFATSTSPCWSSVPNNSSCGFTVTFTPAALGAVSSTLNVQVGGTTLPVALTGTGVQALSLNTSTLAFGSEGVGVPTAAKTVSFYNYSGAAVSPTITLSGGQAGDFATSTSPCWSSVPNNSSCSFTVIFNPAAPGAASSTLNVQVGGTTLPVALTGTGVPTLYLSTSKLAFGNEAVTVPTAPVTLYFYNYTGAAVSPTISLSGGTASDFATSTSPCWSSVPTNSSCAFTVTFTPAAPGAVSSTVNVQVGGTTLPVSLTGTGVNPLYLSTSTLAFGNEGVQVPTAAKTVYFYNYTGAAVSPTLTVSGGASGDFATSTSPCWSSVPNNSSCGFTVTFNPAALGSVSSTLNVQVGGTTLPVALTGTGVNPLYLSASKLAFGTESVGAPTAPVTLYFYNYTGAPVSPTITLSGGATGDFAASTSPCWSSVPTSTSCGFTVTFTPATTGSVSSTLNVQVGATTLPLVLTGTGK